MRRSFKKLRQAGIAPSNLSPLEARAAEIAAMPWQSIKALADQYGIDKGDGQTWKQLAIPIADAEAAAGQ